MLCLIIKLHYILHLFVNFQNNSKLVFDATYTREANTTNFQD